VKPRPEVAVGALAVEHGRLLCIRQGHGPGAGLWSLPGGRVETGESLHEALVREVFEETGLEVVVDRFVGYVERIGDDYHFVILDFAVTLLDTDADPIAADDAAEAAWVPFEDLGDLRLVDGLYEFLRDHDVLPD
jgi:mutator protein MutT